MLRATAQPTSIPMAQSTDGRVFHVLVLFLGGLCNQLPVNCQQTTGKGVIG